MKVKELIEKLKKLDPELAVVHYVYSGAGEYPEDVDVEYSDKENCIVITSEQE